MSVDNWCTDRLCLQDEVGRLHGICTAVGMLRQQDSPATVKALVLMLAAVARHNSVNARKVYACHGVQPALDLLGAAPQGMDSHRGWSKCKSITCLPACMLLLSLRVRRQTSGCYACS
jgi:hypothetical protein